MIKTDSPLFTINPNVTLEQASNYASDLMRCIVTVTGEACDCTPETSRNLACTTQHLATLAKAFVDHSDDRLKRHPPVQNICRHRHTAR